MYKDLFVFFEPGIRCTELDVDESFEFTLKIFGNSGRGPPITDDDVVKTMLVRAESFNQIFRFDI